MFLKLYTDLPCIAGKGAQHPPQITRLGSASLAEPGNGPGSEASGGGSRTERGRGPGNCLGDGSGLDHWH